MHEERLKAVIAEQPYPILFAVLGGAHLCGFPSENSDFDLQGAHILPLTKVVGLEPENETIEKIQSRDGMKIDLETHDVFKYFSLLLKKNGFVLEQIFSDIVVYETVGFSDLKQVAARCISRNHAYHYRGAAQSLWRQFDKQRQLKPLLYMYRMLLTGIHLMETGRVECNLVSLNELYKLPYLGDLLTLKLQGMDNILLEDININFHERESRRLLKQLEEARMSSLLPEDPEGKADLHDLLIQLRMKYQGE